MGAADKRIAELLDRWLASVELHARYLDLDAAAYAKAQAWPKHERPTRWVIDLARTRLNELKRLHAERIAKGDTAFAEALELMGFLANLVGSEHVERFIPLAVESPHPAKPRAEARPEPAAVDSTIEQTAPHRTRSASAPARSAERTRAAPRTARKPAAAPPAKASAVPARQPDDEACESGQGHGAGHRRRRAAAELGPRVAADCGPDRAACGPAERAGRLEDTAQPPRRDRSTSEAPARLNGRPGCRGGRRRPPAVTSRAPPS